MKPWIYIFISTEKLNFAKMSVTTFLHSHDGLNPNYKQVLGELSQPVITGSTPGHRVRRTVAPKGSSLLGLVQQSSSVRGKRHTTRVLCDVLNSVIDFMMMKRCHMHTSLTCIEVWPTCYQGRNITNALLYIGLMTWCHESLHLEKIPS